MKIKLLFCAVIAFSFASISQKKLITYTSKYYNEGGSINFIDSNHYVYSTWQGSLTENEPKFLASIDNHVYQYSYELPEVNYSTREYFNGNAYPLLLNSTNNRSYNIFYQVTKDSNSYSKIIYTYNFTNGKVAQIDDQYFDEAGITKCAIEKAYLNGEISWKKPISCHLYPIRLGKVSDSIALNYDEWPICKPACTCGEQLNVPVYKFLKEPIIRAFGESFFQDLVEVDKALKEK